ncbi:hypothetical protein V6N12_045273 [Hibiscus sabdariffa]|uniref:Uncharacterized protein n=1 Tax=Hibiscus sabdariffa TaxID=183260 RepID=A0ABR2G2I8_9ROSI
MKLDNEQNVSTNATNITNIHHDSLDLDANGDINVVVKDHSLVDLKKLEGNLEEEDIVYRVNQSKAHEHSAPRSSLPTSQGGTPIEILGKEEKIRV